MTKVMFDSWAFIEIFENGPSAFKVRKVMNGCEKYTTTLNVYEVFHRLKIDKGVNEAQEAVQIIEQNVTVLPIDVELAQTAAGQRAQLKAKNNGLSLVDIFTYVAAQSIGATVLTGDSDYKGLPGVMLF